MQSIFKLYLVQLPDSKADLCFSALFHHIYIYTDPVVDAHIKVQVMRSAKPTWCPNPSSEREKSEQAGLN